MGEEGGKESGKGVTREGEGRIGEGEGRIGERRGAKEGREERRGKEGQVENMQTVGRHNLGTYTQYQKPFTNYGSNVVMDTPTNTLTHTPTHTHLV